MRAHPALVPAIILTGIGGGILHAGDDDAPRPLSDRQRTAVLAVEERAEELKAVNKAIWEFAEVGLEEHRSSALLVEILEENGFEVETGVAGMPTAFVASFGGGAPVIGILAEYDALPGLSQEVAPHRQAREEGAPGHGCGHSGLGAGALGAALAAKAAMEEHGLAGTIRLYGTPAEETLIGKVYMLLDGRFDDLDACLHWHPATKNMAWGGSSKAMVSVKFTFKGIAAHSSSSPHRGRSALDAVELMNVGVNFMREHVKEDSRMHYVITDGGGQPNVVPPEATVWYFIRSDSHEDVERNFEWVREIARGAAMMTRTEMAMRIDTDCHEIIPNAPLTAAIDAALRAVGPPEFTEEEHEFARQIQRPLAEEFSQAFEATLNEGVSESDGGDGGGGSTDVGDVSWRVPTGGLRTACAAEGSPGHSWQNVACIGSSIGEKGILYAAKSLAATAVQLLEDDGLRSAARADFEQRIDGRPYTSLIPEGQQAPRSIR